MKQVSKISMFILLAGMLFHISCKREYSCEGCATKNNKPPIALAGPDKVITLPTDSVLLDGRSSSDPDGMISSYLWTKISGPASFTIVKPSDSITKVKSLVAGNYLFELKVADNGGLSAKDTVQVIVKDSSRPNQPPVANAGPDQTIDLPTHTVNLNGSGSTDPDNNIASYQWTKISGPISFSISNANAVQTQVTTLVQGVYRIELKVTDLGGLFSKDTMQITVNAQASLPSCDPGTRQLINTQLIPVGTLSHWRDNISIASANNKILFAGGNDFTDNPGYIYSTVDIYDVTTNSWSGASLSQPKCGMGVAVLGNKIFFAGGKANLSGNATIDWSSAPATSRIDIYDASTNTWSIDSLSMARFPIGASTNNKVLFAGGNIWSGLPEASRVDVYDGGSHSWSTASLSLGRMVSTATAIGDNVFFAGGYYDNGGITSTIDIYNASSNSWSVSSLSPLYTNWGPAGIAVGNKNYWAGGSYYIANSTISQTNHVEIREINNQASTFGCLFQPNSGFGVVQKDNKIIFFTGTGVDKKKFDIYDVANGTWSIGVLPVTMTEVSIISVNNTIYVAGGFVNGFASSQVWKLDF